MSDPAPDLVPLGRPADGADRWVVEHGGRRLAVFDVGGRLVVTDDACPHRGGPLSEGVVRNGAVMCPWHWYTFDLRSGACRGAGQPPLRRYAVVEQDGARFAEEPPRVVRSWSEVLRAHARGED
jgi:nitrite reductase (NADH) small subunit